MVSSKALIPTLEQHIEDIKTNIEWEKDEDWKDEEHRDREEGQPRERYWQNICNTIKPTSDKFLHHA